MQHYGLTQEDYYTVVFAVSRACNTTASHRKTITRSFSRCHVHATLRPHTGRLLHGRFRGVTCMQLYGLTQEDYYTVVFAVSRACNTTASHRKTITRSFS